VDPSIRYTGENDLIWDVEIDDEIERGSLFSEMCVKEFSLAYRPRKAVQYPMLIAESI
jgi:hypothetical protein